MTDGLKSFVGFTLGDTSSSHQEHLHETRNSLNFGELMLGVSGNLSLSVRRWMHGWMDGWMDGARCRVIELRLKFLIP